MSMSLFAKNGRRIANTVAMFFAVDTEFRTHLRGSHAG